MLYEFDAGTYVMEPNSRSPAFTRCDAEFWLWLGLHW